MVLAMSRPQLRKGSQVPRFRKRVPADLVAVVGRREVVFSLGTKDPVEAKRRWAEELGKLEARWAQLRRNSGLAAPDEHVSNENAGPGCSSLSECEAGERAGWMYAHWLGLHRENPSQQRFWPTDLYRHLWRPAGVRFEPREDGRVAVLAVLNFA